MLITIIRYLQGYLRIRITGYSPERFLNLCSHHNIYIWGLKPETNCYEMFITIRGFRRLKPILKKTRTKVMIIRRLGLPFFLYRYRKRKIFFCGAVFCVVMIYTMSLFVWDINIDGNLSRTDETILDFLQTRHVVHGMKKSSVDCERIVKDIRKEFDDIIWVSAYVDGTRLMIKVKENSDTVQMEELPSEDTPVDIISEKDGVIRSIITRSGVPFVKPGDSVKAGDILVSGKVEVKNDAGEVINYHNRHSDADIVMETTIPYEEELSFSYSEKQYTGSQKHLFYLKFGNHKISFNFMKHTYKESEKFSKEIQLKLGEHFYIPVSFGTIQIREYHSKKKVYTEKEMQIMLSTEFQRFCEDLEKKNIKILEKDVRIYLKKGSGKAKGTLRIEEEIGEKS